MKRAGKFLLILGLALGLAAASAIVTFHVAHQELARLYQPTPAVEKVDEVGAYLDRYFIDEYSEKTLADGAAAGMIAAAGDEWSYYLSAGEYAARLAQSGNAYVGIGVTILLDEAAGGFTITGVTPGGPADEAGVLVGDLLIACEGENALELGQEQLVSRVRGEAGTGITLTFRRDGETFDMTIIRASVATEVVTYTLRDDGIAVIGILNFDERCAEDTIAAVERALEAGAAGIVFDVRNNPGGLKAELVKVLDRLLPEGVLFRSVDYAGEEKVDPSDAVCVELPMAVLVNENSFSAAEFFAAALQEYEAAVIVGTQTYGKGNFQNTFELSDGSAICISVGRYYTPRGVSLTGVGLTPDVEVGLTDEQYALLYYGQLPPEEDPQLQAALEALRGIPQGP